jgi:hypothetical protein
VKKSSTTRLWRAGLSGIAVMALAAGLSACGDDDDADDASSETTAEESSETTEATDEEANVDNEEFCESFTDVDVAFGAAPGDDPEALVPYIQEEILPPLETARGSMPEDITDEVTVMVEAVEAVANEGDFSGFESEAFAEATAVVYPWLGENCDVQAVDVTAIDFAYEGMPEELEAGKTVITLDNQTESGEIHEMAFARVNDGVDLGVDELLALPEEELMQNIAISGAAFAPPDAVGGTTLEFTPGRWVYVCMIPTGSVDGAEGDGPPHAVHGMAGEFTVS